MLQNQNWTLKYAQWAWNQMGYPCLIHNFTPKYSRLDAYVEAFDDIRAVIETKSRFLYWNQYPDVFLCVNKYRHLMEAARAFECMPIYMIHTTYDNIIGWIDVTRVNTTIVVDDFFLVPFNSFVRLK